MEIAVSTRLFAKRNMNVYAGQYECIKKMQRYEAQRAKRGRKEGL